MSHDSPSPSWYEPPDEDELEDDEPAPAAEVLTVSAGIVWWTAA